MKSISVIAVAGLVALVSATPVEKRAQVVHTVIEEVTETVDITTTIWVKATNGAQNVNQLQAEPTSVHHKHHHSSKPKATTTSTPPIVAPEPVATTPSTTPTTIITSPTSSPSVSVPAYIPPVVESKPPVVVPETTQAPAPIPEPTIEAPAPSSAPSTSPVEEEDKSTGGACGEIGGECEGEITFYEAGLGACGWTNDGSSEDVFALAHGMMGTQSNGNPFCGRMATIELDGKTVQAKLVDKCMGCEGEDIDLSTHLFNQIANPDEGRLSGVKWHFTS